MFRDTAEELKAILLVCGEKSFGIWGTSRFSVNPDKTTGRATSDNTTSTVGELKQCFIWRRQSLYRSVLTFKKNGFCIYRQMLVLKCTITAEVRHSAVISFLWSLMLSHKYSVRFANRKWKNLLCLSKNETWVQSWISWHCVYIFLMAKISVGHTAHPPV